MPAGVARLCYNVLMSTLHHDYDKLPESRVTYDFADFLDLLTHPLYVLANIIRVRLLGIPDPDPFADPLPPAPKWTPREADPAPGFLPRLRRGTRKLFEQLLMMDDRSRELRYEHAMLVRFKSLPEPKNRPSNEEQEREVRANADIFYDKLLPELLAQGHKGEYAVMRDRKVVEIVDSPYAANIRERELFGESGEPSSVQRISDEPVFIGTPGVRFVTLDD